MIMDGRAVRLISYHLNEAQDGRMRIQKDWLVLAAFDQKVRDLVMTARRLDDPDGEAEDLQPIRSLDHMGQLRQKRRRTRKRGDRSTNPHGVTREKLSGADADE